MSKMFAVFFIVLFSITVMSQDIRFLKDELSFYKSGEKYGDKIALARILHAKVPFDRLGVEYICRYYYDRNIDSVGIFLNKLILDYPDSTKAYIRKTENIRFIKDIDREAEMVSCLEQGYLVDSLDVKLNYMLAELYYMDFLKPYFKPSWGIGLTEDDEKGMFLSNEARKQVFANSEDKALYYMNNLIEIEPKLRHILYFPIQQITKYKYKDSTAISVPLIDNDCYFPIWYFVNLEDGWDSDLSRNYLFELEMSPSRSLSSFLEKINEPCLYNKKDEEVSEIFRFTWLRTFHNPICIRLEQVKDHYRLYWKLMDGSGGYDYGKLKKFKSKNLTKSEWNKFATLFKAMKLSELPNRRYYPMTDGASWTIEYWTPYSFKAHDTNIPSENIIDCCKYLLSLTNLKIKADDIY